MAVKSDLACLKDIPNINILSKRFEFIEDLVLRENIAIVFQYLIFLINLERSHTLPGAINYLIYKDMIIHTASITEALLYYGLTKSLEKKKSTLEIFGVTKDKYKNFKQIYKTPTGEEIGAIIKIKEYITPDEMQFNDFIPAALHAGLVDGSLSKELAIIRKQRNRVHLSSFSRVDNGYTMAEVEQMFKTVNKLKAYIIEYLAP
ncbi:hypothetical protein COX93_00490 [Candidatus Nomurabacteria bacterium CG_4_10_14_0_2_um_filter_30_12]|uniref:RiboL-PSP-HEPN domain-containing protein n=1 Tax=Candidatus Nomurabacteria bacterium CG_4_10_14_0_2_um_filter_30_12 TaxID=1974727 RepID=A0A2J0MGI8_9BACT|nr:MAG: hypothetical protein COX93_00490 [Candidatus Nomurabacteria bacterium CG_4_10_14_0_2_um_filter_30_12]